MHRLDSKNSTFTTSQKVDLRWNAQSNYGRYAQLKYHTRNSRMHLPDDLGKRVLVPGKSHTKDFSFPVMGERQGRDLP